MDNVPAPEGLSDAAAFRQAVLEGSTVRAIAARHEMPKSSVHKMIQRGGRAFIDQVHLDLLTSAATGELPAILLPDQPGPTMDRALDLVRYLTNELEQRGIQIRVSYRTAHNGVAIVLQDAHPHSKTARSTH